MIRIAPYAPALPALVLAALATGCVATGMRQPDYVERADPFEEPTPGADTAVRSWTGAGEAASDVLLSGTGPVGLAEVLELAEGASPEILAAREHAAAASGRIWQTELYPNPSLEVEVEEIPLRQGSPAERKATVGIEQPIVLGSRRSAATSAQSRIRGARLHAVEETRRQVVGRVHAAFVEMVYLRELTSTYDELLEDAEATREIARARLAARAAPEAEVIKIDLEVEWLSKERDATSRSLDDARARLALLLGGTSLPAERFPDRLPEVALELDLDDLIREVTDDHPAVAAREEAVEAATHLLEESRARRIPDVSLRVAYGRLGREDEDILEAGLSVPLPLFDRNQGEILERTHLVARAEEATEITRRELVSRVHETFTRYTTTADSTVRYRDRMVPAAERALVLAREGYRAGHSSFLDVIDAERTRVTIRVDALRALRDHHLALARLREILGRSCGEDEYWRQTP